MEGVGEHCARVPPYAPAFKPVSSSCPQQVFQLPPFSYNHNFPQPETERFSPGETASRENKSRP